MPPADRRSPASRSTSTSSRSWSILMGAFSVTPDTIPRVVESAHDAAHGDEQRHDAEDSAGDLENVVGARVPGGVDEVGLDGADPAADDRLRVGPVDELVDRAGQPVSG